jgi:hypothetical protein
MQARNGACDANNETAGRLPWPAVLRYPKKVLSWLFEIPLI